MSPAAKGSPPAERAITTTFAGEEERARPMASTLALEQAEQRRWKLRPKWARVNWFDLMVEREFLSPDEQKAKESAALRQMVRFAAASVPYYRGMFKRLGITAGDIQGPEDLPALPPLARTEVQEHAVALRAQRRPPGHKVSGMTRTSGSTGQPVEVIHTQFSHLMFNILKQRQMRWARFDPAGRFAMIRPPRDLPPEPGGEPAGEDETHRYPIWWPLVGPYFETGPLFGFSNNNSLENQVEWVEEHRPDYLLGLSAELEHLALGFQDRPRLESLRGLQAISQQLTPEMRRRIEGTFGVPVFESYGFNEIGILAFRCTEGGRYHVNTEHCLVEVVDEDGQPCRPGQRGRILATTLTNAAMPLLRYDSDDLAEAVDGPCPCGRTLPAFGAIHGRYRRIVSLPPDTMTYVSAVQRALADMPAELSKPLRQYQLHQFRDGRFEFRLVAAGALAAAFTERIESEWKKAGAPEPPPLAFLVVDEIPRTPGGKFQDFTSDFAPPPTPAPEPSGESG
jgi:phenylacetate-CoA ligase